MIQNADHNIRQGHYHWLMKKGVPDVLAALMVSRMDTDDQPDINGGSTNWLYSAFYWDQSEEGHEFWTNIATDLFKLENRRQAF